MERALERSGDGSWIERLSGVGFGRVFDNVDVWSVEADDAGDRDLGTGEEGIECGSDLINITVWGAG